MRRYPDPYPKPELLCALTRFEAFCGVRPLDETVAPSSSELGAEPLRRRPSRRSGVGATIDGAVAPGACRSRRSSRPAPTATVPRPAGWPTWPTRYPGDPSVVVTLLLNYVQLDPGEALQLGPGNLHAYLGGAGIELMGASDNVVRAGLTNKPVDIDTAARGDGSDAADGPGDVEPRRRTRSPSTSIRLLRLVGPAERRADDPRAGDHDVGATGYLAPGETSRCRRRDRVHRDD